MRIPYFACIGLGLLIVLPNYGWTQEGRTFLNGKRKPIEITTVASMTTPPSLRLIGTVATSAHRISQRWGQIRQAQEVTPDLVVASWAVGGTLGSLMLVPMIGNIYALAHERGQTGWGAVGLFAIGFLGGMSVYIAGTGGFFPHESYWYATLPMWGLGLGVVGLSIANLVIARRKKRTPSPVLQGSINKQTAMLLQKTQHLGTFPGF